MKRIYFSYSHKITITARFLLLGMVVFGLILPVGVQAIQLSDLTVTPESPTPVATDLPSTPIKEYTWLSFPEDSSQLASDRSLDLLAGKFIHHGLVDASSCADGGMLKSGAASPCGELVAHNAVTVWQNQFDAEILKVAQESGVPPFILKNVFIKESQFWPETYHNPTYGGEYSLGHLTTMGVDTLLRWNRPYYKKICNQNFNKETCSKEYVFLDPAIQAGLKGVIITSINSDCSTCLGGVNLEKARNSISVTAAMLVANRTHVQWLVNGFSSSKGLSKENSWRYTLASYNAGPGCFTDAFYGTRGNGNPLSWKDVSQRFSGVCKGVVNYVAFMEVIDTADPAILMLASSDTTRAARMILGPLATPPTVSISTSLAMPTVSVTETPTVSSLTVTPVTETPTVSSLTVTPDTETPTVSSLTVTPNTETPTVSSSTAMPVTETLIAPALTATPVIETPTPTIGIVETSVAPSSTPTLVSPTETLIPTNTATPIPQPTAFSPQADTVTGEIVVKFGGLVPEFLVESAVGSAGGEIQSQVDTLGLTIVSAPQAQISQVLAKLQGSILVDYAEPNYAVQAFYTPNDSGYVNQSYLADMQIPQAWDITKGEGIIVAVIDTGVDITHPDLATNIWINSGEDGLDANGNNKRTNYIDDDNDGYVDNWMGWNFVNNNNDARDSNGHGTQTAGIIAAQMDNTQGISGIAPNARIMAIKALDASGFGTYSQVAEAIIYAVDHGAKVINLGFGGTANSELLLAATDYAYNHGVTVVAAGGNTGTQTLIYPAANPNVIGVSAVDENLNAAAFSSYSEAIRISAPGEGIYSTAPNGNYTSMSGTSMSAAQVSGVAALLATQPQFNSPSTLSNALFSTASDLGEPGLDIHYGYGLVHAFDALNYLPGSISPTPTVSPTPNGSVTPTSTLVDTSGVTIMSDMAGSTIGTYASGLVCTTTTYNTQLGGTTPPGSSLQVSDAVTSAIPIGFDFWYMGTRYTEIYASSNGWLSFNSPAGNTCGTGTSCPTNDLDNNLGRNGPTRPFIAPLWDDLSGNGGVASYQLAGSAPNRTFTFEWWNFQWNAASGVRISFRAVLHESTGDIDFIYYQNDANAPVTTPGASIGITGTGSGLGNFISLQETSACPAWSTVTETNSLVAKPASNTTYSFVPGVVVLNPPSNLSLINLTATSLTLNWTDNATGEDGFGIYTSTDGINYTYFGQVAANATSFNATGLLNSANNYWKIYAVVEGNASTAADITAPSALSFSNIKTTSMTLSWTDNATNETGYLIYNSTDNINFNYVAQAAVNATSYNVTSGLTANTTYYWRVQAINNGAISAAVSATRATNTLPVVAISAPTNNSTFAKGTAITFTGTATDVQDGNISSGLVWYSDLSGPFGTGASVTFSGLIPGTHTITAQSTDANGETGKALVTNITITSLSGPHGGFNGSADQCALCHRAHSAVGDAYLTTDPNSVLTSDAFCLSCHDGTTATAVSTHSNKNWTPSQPLWKAETNFEVRCIQCHDTHGTTNLFAIRTDIKSSLTPETAIYPILFTSLTGPNSFDDNASANRLCVSCHTSTSNHPGGVNHLGGQSYAGQSCVACHPHNADSSTTTMDGFMPVRSTNP